MRYFLVLTLVFCGACADKKIDTTAAKAQIEASKPKRIRPEQLVTQMDIWGKEMARQATQGRPLPELSAAFGASIVWIPRQQLAQAKFDTKTQQVLQAYAYNMTHQIPMYDNLQKLPGDTSFVFTSPLLMSAKLAQRDSLRGQADQSLLGIWTIFFSKKNVIQRINPKELRQLRASGHGML
jgi:hypothetical protein